MTHVRRLWLALGCGLIVAVAFIAVWSAVYPHASVLQLAVAGVLGSLCGQGVAAVYVQAREKDRVS